MSQSQFKFLKHTAKDDAAREWEAYRYYRPLQDIHNANASAKPGSISSHDNALAAFAQLGALRLNARRALISLFDRRSQHVLAEATRTISLKDNSVYQQGDELWLGAFSAPRSKAPCEYACGLIIPPAIEEMDDGDGDVVVFPDIKNHPLWCQKTFVLNKPYGRFYAGVPIISPAGYNIGVYCVLDDMPRDGLARPDIDFMKDMAATVMSHLVMVRAKDELWRSQRMVQGLGDFIEGKPRLSKRRRLTPEVLKPGVTSAHDRKALETRYEHGMLPSPPLSHEETSSSSGPLDMRPAPLTHSITPPDDVSVDGTFGHEPVRVGSQHSSRAKESGLGDDLPSAVSCVFQRAANIVLEAANFDGALFLDASVGSFGGLVETTEDTGPQSVPDAADDRPAAVLGSSLFKRAGPSALPDPSPPLPMSEKFLAYLLKKYPKGRIWSFDKDEEGAFMSTTQDDHPMLDSLSRELSNEEKADQIERSIIQRLFPGFQCLALVGTWDSRRDRWFAGSIVWTCSPTRIFSPDEELAYLVAFGQNIIAEVAALDIKRADQAKATFISSISHELRTPLHGIIGSLDVLQNTELDSAQHALLNTMETCSKTLLDTFDNLLNYAKINNLTKASRSGHPPPLSSSKPEPAESNVSMVKLDLSVLVEEVVDAALAGHGFSNMGVDRSDFLTSGATSNRRSSCRSSGLNKLDVTLEFDDFTESNWIFQAQPGAWRRILLNLVGNSLKYTEKGFVAIKMSSKQLHGTGAEDKSQVTLSVTDTGKGMSEDFMKSHLFSPFMQEDPLVPGTGLGLSFVKQIVTSMGGTVSVKSKQGEGTEVRLSLPMTHASPGSGRESSVPESAIALLDKIQSVRLNFQAIDSITSTQSRATDPNSLESSFVKLCGTWFKTDASYCAKPTDSSIYTTTDAEFQEVTRAAQTFTQSNLPTKRPCVVLCKDTSVHASKILGCSFVCHIEFVTQPWGPNKLARALSNCIDCLHTPCSKLSQSAHSAMTTPASLQPLAFRKSSENLPMTVDARSGPQQEIEEPSPLRPSPKRSTTDVDVTLSKLEVASPPIAPATLPGLQQAQSDTSVLLVDDNRINMQLLTTFMKKRGHAYDTAKNGLEALQLYEMALSPSCSLEPSTEGLRPTTHRPYDFILMDINMPVMDGLESTRRIRAVERSKGTKPATIMALTGVASADMQMEARASGVDLYWTKPVRLRELGSAIDERMR